ncbi:MAG: AtpZ/AtpI family protein [Dehalococcoidales bacterium]|nr:AtpZ/AtpI family protein [Dehalococcoidales bacterium]
MRRWQAALSIIGIGWFVGLSLLGGVLGGLWLDNKLNTQPLFVLVGLFLGFAVAAYGVYQMLLPLLRNKNDKGDN